MPEIPVSEEQRELFVGVIRERGRRVSLGQARASEGVAGPGSYGELADVIEQRGVVPVGESEVADAVLRDVLADAGWGTARFEVNRSQPRPDERAVEVPEPLAGLVEELDRHRTEAAVEDRRIRVSLAAGHGAQAPALREVLLEMVEQSSRLEREVVVLRRELAEARAGLAEVSAGPQVWKRASMVRWRDSSTCFFRRAPAWA